MKDAHPTHSRVRGAAGASEIEHARLEAILASLADAILVLDRQGEVILTNAAYDRLFGVTAAFTPQA